MRKEHEGKEEEDRARRSVQPPSHYRREAHARLGRQALCKSRPTAYPEAANNCTLKQKPNPVRADAREVRRRLIGKAHSFLFRRRRKKSHMGGLEFLRPLIPIEKRHRIKGSKIVEGKNVARRTTKFLPVIKYRGHEDLVVSKISMNER